MGWLGSIDGNTPHVHPEAWIAPGAILVGRVTLGPGASVWYGSVLRADDDEIIVGADCNIQDQCCLHVDPGEPVDPGRAGQPRAPGHCARGARRRRGADRHRGHRARPGLDRRGLAGGGGHGHPAGPEGPGRGAGGGGARAGRPGADRRRPGHVRRTRPRATGAGPRCTAPRSGANCPPILDNPSRHHFTSHRVTMKSRERFTVPRDSSPLLLGIVTRVLGKIPLEGGPEMTLMGHAGA